MTIPESYPIHRCVYRNDAFALKELLKNEEIRKRIDEPDNHNNSPLHLALMLGHTECVLPLINNGCNIVSPNSFGWSPVDEATMLGNEEIIKRLSVGKLAKFVGDFHGKEKSPLERWNKILPNMYLKLRVKFKSPVPVLAEMCPKDTIEVFKSGDCIRINTTIGGMITSGIPRAIKGKYSFIAKIDKNNNILRAYLLDCVKRKYEEFYPNLPNWCVENLTKPTMEATSIFKVLLDFSSMSVKQKRGNLLKRGRKTLHLERGKNYKADIYKIKGLQTDALKRYRESVIGPYKSDVKTSILKVNSKVKRSESIISEASSGSDSSLNNFIHKIEKEAKNDKNKISKEKYYKVDDDDDDDDDDFDSDSDASDNENSEKSDRLSIRSTSILEKYVNQADPNVFDPNVEKHLVEMIMAGYDDQKNVITKKDVDLLRKKYPKYLNNVIMDNMEKDMNQLDKLQTVTNAKVTKNISKDGKTVEYEVHDFIDDTLNWDEVYNMKHAETEDDIKGKQSQKKMNSDRMTEFDWNNNKLTEDIYFDPTQTEDLHVGRIFDVKEEKKTLSNTIKIWMSRDNEFPISLDHIKPIIAYVYSFFFEKGSTKDSHVDILKKIYDDVHGSSRYPVKVNIPILPVLKFQLKTVDCNLDPKVIPDGAFDIPSNYVVGEVLPKTK